MKNNRLQYWLVACSLFLLFAAIFFYNGYFNLVNNYIYSNSDIPVGFEQDKYYFMEKKLVLKNRTIYMLFFSSILLFMGSRRLDFLHKSVRFLVGLQLLVVSIAFFLWLIRPKGMLF